MDENSYTVLIVDDDPEIVDLLKDHFRSRNCAAVATNNPEVVVDKLRNFTIKLMLLDLKMEKLDGFKVLEKIKEAGLTLPPTIIITGFLPRYKDQLNAYQIDLQDVVQKPFDFQVMEQCINRKLGQQIVVSEVGSDYERKLYKKNRCRLGFVEDESDLVKDLAQFFEERNYKVSCFGNGKVALDGLKKEPVDILFVDIKVPGIPGDQLIEELSKLSNPPHMIPMSADPLSDEMKARLNSLKCGEFLEKPFDLVQLIEMVKTVAIQKGLLG